MKGASWSVGSLPLPRRLVSTLLYSIHWSLLRPTERRSRRATSLFTPPSSLTPFALLSSHRSAESRDSPL